MRRSGAFLLSVVAAVAVLLSSAQAAPIEAYGRLPSLENIDISPDGANLAWIMATDEQRVLVVFNVEQQKVIAGVKVGDQKVRHLTWADAQHLLITISKTAEVPLGVIGPRQEFYLMLSYDVLGRKLYNPMDHVEKVQALNIIYGAPEPRTVNGRTVVYVKGESFPDHRGVITLFRASLDHGEVRSLDDGRGKALNWIIDAQGGVIAETTYDEPRQHWALNVKRNGSWSEILGHDTSIDIPTIGGLTADGKAVLVYDETAGDGWRALNLADGSWDASARYAVSTLLPDPSTRLIIGGEREDSRKHYVFFNPDDEQVWENIAIRFDGENVELKAWSADRKRIVVRVSGPRTGDAYLLIDLKNHKTFRLADEYSDIHADDVAPSRPIVYAAADGMQIPAYLTLPKGKEEKNLPLVVLVHGGPAMRDHAEFDWWSQALASRGYAVLQPQFRGSAGFSKKFLEAGYGEWGGKMLTDVSAGVKELAQQGRIDPKRVCVVGASYGGYAALAGATLQSNIYRCAVAVAGVSDPRGLLKWEQSRSHYMTNLVGLRSTDRFMGVSGPDDKKLDDISPLAHAGQASVPILLLHGKDDTVVPIAQSEDMARALQRAGKPVQFIKLNGEDHWLSSSETRLQMLKESVAFLERYNPPNE